MSKMSELHMEYLTGKSFIETEAKPTRHDLMDFTCRRILNDALEVRDIQMNLTKEQENDLLSAIQALQERVRRLA